jgi:hypothetical protein
MAKKIKRHVLMIAHRFMSTHPRKGQFTWFQEKIHLGQKSAPHPPIAEPILVKDTFGSGTLMTWYPKITTIRPNYVNWKRKIDEVNRGEAVLVLKYWSGKPYNSSPVEILELGKGQVGIQRVVLYNSGAAIFDDATNISKSCPFNEIEQLWINDGFNEFNDFFHWFCPPLKRVDVVRKLEFDGALIHFTNFKY